MKWASEPLEDAHLTSVDRLQTLETRLGYGFSDRSLLQLALTHRSAPKPSDTVAGGVGGEGHNERLEFLGDAVLDLAVSALLYDRFPRASEGLLSTWRSTLVNTRILGGVGEELLLGELLEMGKGEDSSGGRKKLSILGNSVEAVFGAIYLDGGYEAVLKVAEGVLGSRMCKLEEDRWDKDYKTMLQEKLQASGFPLPRYRVISVSGAPHDRLFKVECQVNGGESGLGSGRSKRLAEQAAAAEVLGALRSPGRGDGVADTVLQPESL
ncbi:MAG: RNAse III [Magnetococcales bacterium]|nr:RNAse III [Magnetococcales bacterium]HIJ85537.1 ribonuclease III [Magnetococcales bacterium]